MGWRDFKESGGLNLRRCAFTDLHEEQALLTPDLKRYLCSVLRLGNQDQFIAFDGQGFERIFALEELDNEWWAKAIGPIYEGRQGAPLALCFALPKGDKLDQVARQITELGIAELYLWSADRSVGVWKKDKVKNKLGRLQRVISEAARQSGRADLLTVNPPQQLDKLITQFSKVPLKMFFDPQASSGWPINNEHLNSNLTVTKGELECVVLVGPEGGLSPIEIEKLKTNMWRAIKLHTPILRTETAGVVACALALDRLGYLA